MSRWSKASKLPHHAEATPSSRSLLTSAGVSSSGSRRHGQRETCTLTSMAPDSGMEVGCVVSANRSSLRLEDRREQTREILAKDQPFRVVRNVRPVHLRELRCEASPT